jgi:hypothetical protein
MTIVAGTDRGTADTILSSETRGRVRLTNSTRGALQFLTTSICKRGPRRSEAIGPMSLADCQPTTVSPYLPGEAGYRTGDLGAAVESIGSYLPDRATACNRDMVNLFNHCCHTVEAHEIASLAHRTSHGMDDPERVSHG